MVRREEERQDEGLPKKLGHASIRIESQQHDVRRGKATRKTRRSAEALERVWCRRWATFYWSRICDRRTNFWNLYATWSYTISTQYSIAQLVQPQTTSITIDARAPRLCGVYMYDYKRRTKEVQQL